MNKKKKKRENDLLVPEAFTIKRSKKQISGHERTIRDMLKVILLGSVPISLLSQKMEFVKDIC